MVEVLYAPLGVSMIHLHLDVPAHATVGEVLELSGLLTQYPEIREYSVGIFSKLVDYSTIVKQGDRIEIYRPLLINPMDKRRQRAKSKSNIHRS